MKQLLYKLCVSSTLLYAGTSAAESESSSGTMTVKMKTVVSSYDKYASLRAYTDLSPEKSYMTEMNERMFGKSQELIDFETQLQALTSRRVGSKFKLGDAITLPIEN